MSLGMGKLVWPMVRTVVVRGRHVGIDPVRFILPSTGTGIFNRFPTPVSVRWRSEVASPKTREESLEGEAAAWTQTDPETAAYVFHDFNYTLLTDYLPDEKLLDERFRKVNPEDKPLVLLVGWAGATEKNLNKYVDIYRKAGCLTLSYNVPSRFIFETIHHIPYLAARLLQVIQDAHLSDRPIVFHLMSDTGLMMHQGLEIVLRDRGNPNALNLLGCVYDSCPGPHPNAMKVKTWIAFIVVFWTCLKRDGVKGIAALYELQKFIAKFMWPGLLNNLKGLPAVCPMMEGIFVGHTITYQQGKSHPELFLYSERDFYVTPDYIEKEVLARRQASGREIFSKRFNKSEHVGHLKVYKEDYYQSVHNFLHSIYFRKLSRKT